MENLCLLGLLQEQGSLSFAKKWRKMTLEDSRRVVQYELKVRLSHLNVSIQGHIVYALSEKLRAASLSLGLNHLIKLIKLSKPGRANTPFLMVKYPT